MSPLIEIVCVDVDNRRSKNTRFTSVRVPFGRSGRGKRVFENVPQFTREGRERKLFFPIIITTNSNVFAGPSSAHTKIKFKNIRPFHFVFIDGSRFCRIFPSHIPVFVSGPYLSPKLCLLCIGRTARAVIVETRGHSKGVRIV